MNGSIGGDVSKIDRTVAGKIYAEVERVTDEMLIANDELMHKLLKKCMESWFNRHKSSSAMTMGTENEEPTFDALKEEPCVRYLYEVGLLQCITNPVLGVSPDGMVMMNGNAQYDGQIGCLEIKTRVKATTIARAEAARRECGRVVWCTADDDLFIVCVPKENRIQVLHQAAITFL